MNRDRVVLIVLAILLPLATLAYARPARLVEIVASVSCDERRVCTDDPARKDEAGRMYEDAIGFVEAEIAPLEKRPVMVFCSSLSCYNAFGKSAATARTVGGFCIVIGPHGWKPFYVRHELIHRLQWQRLGVVQMYREPEWLIEGMAYSLSGDPRPALVEPWQSFRSQFEAWYGNVGKGQLWAEAAKL